MRPPAAPDRPSRPAALPLRLRAVLQCPHCGFKVTEKMPLTGAVQQYSCPACARLIEPPPGACCVFCAWASLPCPPRQHNESCP